MPYPYTYARMSVPAGTRQILALIEKPDFNTNAELYYKVDTSFNDYNINNTPASYGFTAISSNNLISVQNNNYVTFSVMGKNIAPVTSKVTVVSMPNFAQLGSFTVNVTVSAAPDPTPNPVNYGEPTYDYFVPSWVQETQLFQGFNVPITLSVAIANTFGTTPELWYWVGLSDPGTTFYDSYVPPASNGYTKINDGGTFVVNSDEYVSFATNNNSPIMGEAVVTLRNVTDGNISLDTFSIIVTTL